MREFQLIGLWYSSICDLHFILGIFIVDNNTIIKLISIITEDIGWILKMFLETIANDIEILQAEESMQVIVRYWTLCRVAVLHA